jgi:DNA-binding transcriptional LysR family regulator
MHTFVCLVDEGSFTGAAERMHLTQQAVSAQVKRLEESVGQQLVTRSRKTVKLTQAGEKLLISARQIAAIGERIRRQFSAIPLEGSVRFGFPPTFGRPMLFPVLSEIRRIHPNLELLCETRRTGSLISRLESGNLDVIIGAQRDGDTLGKVLRREKLFWAGDVEGLVQADSPVPLALLPNPTFLRDSIFELLNHAGRAWTVFFESDDIAALHAAIQSGWGISLVNSGQTLGKEIIVQDTAQHLLPDGGHLEFFLRHDQRGSPIVRSFAAILQAVIVEL